MSRLSSDATAPDSAWSQDSSATKQPLRNRLRRAAGGPIARLMKLLTRHGVLRDAAFTQALCADVQGFSLHAAVHCAADERQALEQLCRYITRPALANERVQCNAAGQVVLKLKTAWRDGTTHIVMSPLQFMQRLAKIGRAHV